MVLSPQRLSLTLSLHSSLCRPLGILSGIVSLSSLLTVDGHTYHMPVPHPYPHPLPQPHIVGKLLLSRALDLRGVALALFGPPHPTSILLGPRLFTRNG